MGTSLLTQCGRHAEAEASLQLLEKRNPKAADWIAIATAWHAGGRAGRRDAAFGKVPLWVGRPLRVALEATGARPAPLVAATETSLPSTPDKGGADHFDRAQMFLALGMHDRAAADMREAMRRKFGGKAPSSPGEAGVLAEAAQLMHASGDDITAKQWIDRALSSNTVSPEPERVPSLLLLMRVKGPADGVLAALAVMDPPRAEKLAQQWGGEYVYAFASLRLRHALRQRDWKAVRAVGTASTTGSVARQDALRAALSAGQCTVAMDLVDATRPNQRLEALVELAESCPSLHDEARQRLGGLNLEDQPVLAAEALASTGDVSGALKRALDFSGTTSAHDRTRVLAIAARRQGDEPLSPDAEGYLQQLIASARPAP